MTPAAGAATVPVARAGELLAAGGVAPDRDPALARLRFGVYADAAALAGADREARYLARVHAVAAVRSSPVFARESALALHGVPYGLEPDHVFTIGGPSTARRKAGVVHATVPIDAADVVTIDGQLVCSLAYALADFARRAASVDAVSAIDDALRRGAVSKAKLWDALGRQGKRGRARAAWAIEFADARAESVGESWSRVRCFELGFAAPELQVWITGRSGARHRVDMRWSRGGGRPVYGEFDGMLKYGELAHQTGRTGVEALAAEKARDEDLLFTGDPAHWVWADVLQPARLEAILSSYRVPRVRRSVRRVPDAA